MSEPYQYFRIKCIGKNHYGYSKNQENYEFSMVNFEIYGEINENY